MLFKKSKMNIKSGLGLGTGRLINYLNTDNCGSPINLFLLPEVDLNTSKSCYKLVWALIYVKSEFFSSSDSVFYGHPPLSDLVKRLRTNILGVTRNQLTQLTEKTWLLYCSKVWDTVKKSSFFVEYMKLMP